MAKKRTKLDRSQRQADQLEKRADTRPEQTPKKRVPRENFSQAAVRIVREAQNPESFAHGSRTVQQRELGRGDERRTRIFCVPSGRSLPSTLPARGPQASPVITHYRGAVEVELELEPISLR
jgi:hypothetical protein